MTVALRPASPAAVDKILDALRAFLWVVEAPARLRGELAERYRRHPPP